MYSTQNMIVYDLEVYINYFLAGFELPTGEVRQFMFTDKDATTHYGHLRQFMRDIKQYGYSLGSFNGKGYDDLILTNFLKNPSTQAAYIMSVQIIEERAPYWRFDNDINSIDLMQILPGRIGLKKVAVCLGHPTLRELPFDPHSALEHWQMVELNKYNVNDLKVTRRLQKELQKEMNLREAMSNRYDLDLISMGEATVAEKIIFHEVKKLDPRADWKLYKNLAKSKYPSGSVIHCDPPLWWYQINEIERAYPMVMEVRYLAEKIFKEDIRILDGYMVKGSLNHQLFLNDVWYSLGVGGLHSVDGPGYWRSGKGKKLVTADVTSYYPNLILTQELSPHHLPHVFLEIYRTIVKIREKAKADGDKVTADVLKIVTNGTYGKTANPGSILYDPYVTANVTVRGQLALLVLIAMLGSHGHRVVSANTDGIEIYCDEDRYQNSVVPITKHWEAITGLNMEFAENEALYQTDVNNYIMVKENGSVKCKGSKFFIPDEGEYDLEHTPMYQIVSRSIQKYLQKGIPIETTIKTCTDIQEFILTQQVTGDWKVYWNGQEVNKMVRFYKSTSPEAQEIIRIPQGATGNEGRVSGSENAMLVIDFPEQFPTDINYDWYIAKANELLNLILRTKSPFMNTLAVNLMRSGIMPTIVNPESNRLSRETPKMGEIDFNSMAHYETLGVATGKRYKLMALRQGAEITHLIHTQRDYPTKTRATIKKNYGFELLYGGNVPIDPWSVIIKKDTRQAALEQYYTETELKRCGWLGVQKQIYK